LLALFPLIFVREPRSQSIGKVLQHLYLRKPQLAIEESATSVSNSAQ
jgi:hypothetical protein